MAYLTLTSEETNTCFKFIGSNTRPEANGGLISSSTSLLSNCNSLILGSSNECLDTCSFYSGPSDSTIIAFGENFDNGEYISSSGSESCGSIAYSGSGETCGSVASSSVSSGSSFSGGCSYSC